MAPRARIVFEPIASVMDVVGYALSHGTTDGVSTMTTNVLTVSTVAQLATAGFEPVTVGTRATKDPETGKQRIIPADQRTRSIVIPELAVDSVPSKFQMLILECLRSTAKAQLSALWEADDALREVPANIWSVDSLLMFAAREAESKRLTKAGLHYWFEASELNKILTAKNNPKLLADWQAKIIGLSAPNCIMSEAECDAIIGTLLKPALADDADSFMGQQIIAKCQKRIDTLRKQLEEVSLEALDI